MFQIECVREPVQLAKLKSDWDRLSQGALMQRHAWMSSWWLSHQDNYRPHVLVAARGGQVCGILPLAETRNTWTGRTLVFVGSGKVCSDDLGLICNEDDGIFLAEAFATFVANSLECCRWDHLNLDGVRDKNQHMQRFLRVLETLTGSSVEIKPSPCCWSASLHGGREAYLGRLSKRARKLLSNAHKEVNDGRSKFQLATTSKQASDFLRVIESLHQSRWKERGIDGCFSEKSFSDFLTTATSALWEDAWTETNSKEENCEFQNRPQQRVQIGLLHIEGRPAAGAVCLLDRDALAVYLTGMNPEFAERRPGWQLLSQFIQHACELGCARIDFLRGDEEYKARLNATPTEQRRYVIASSRWSSQIRNTAYRAASNVKKWWNFTPTTQDPVVTPQPIET